MQKSSHPIRQKSSPFVLRRRNSLLRKRSPSVNYEAAATANNTASLAIPAVSHMTDYSVGKTIGEGSWGKVRLCTYRPTHTKCALKFIERRQSNRKREERLKSEINLAQQLRHPNIVQTYSVVHTEDTTAIVMEHIDGVDLFEFIGLSDRQLSESAALHIFHQIALAVDYCHSKLVVHRDLKPENVMILPGERVKVIDFGLSREISPMQLLTKSQVGSMMYSSPELLLGKGYIGPEADIWSLGVLLYVTLTKSVPWCGLNDSQMMRHLLRGDFDWQPDYGSERVYDLIRQCLTPAVSRRITMTRLLTHNAMPQQAVRIATRSMRNEASQHQHQVVRDLLRRKKFDLEELDIFLSEKDTDSAVYQLYHNLLEAEQRKQAVYL